MLGISGVVQPQSPLWTSPFPLSPKPSDTYSLNGGLKEDKSLSLQGKNSETKELGVGTVQLIGTHSNEYKGRITPETLHGCHLVASRLKDQYDETSRKLIFTQDLQNDYFDIIAQEQTEGRCLIAMDKDWVLPLIGEYLRTDQDRFIYRPEALREKIATYNPIMSMNEPYVRWESQVDFVEHSRPWTVDDLSIYNLTDINVGQISRTTVWDQYDNTVMLVFAPVNALTAGAVNTYIYQQYEFFSAKAYLAIKDLPVSLARDFEYLFPVELNYLRNYVIFSSTRMSRGLLVEAFYRHQISHTFPRLDSKLGAYATYLLAEATFHHFPLSWAGQTLTMGLVGFIQSRDLLEEFGRIMVDLQSRGVLFQALPSYEVAVNLVASSDVKCFYFEGVYYASLPANSEELSYSANVLNPDNPLSSQEKVMNTRDLSLVELKGPLQSMSTYPELTKSYLSSLGYQVNPDPEPFYRQLPLGYRTIALVSTSSPDEITENNTVTTYYYKSTFGEEIEVYHHNGSWSRILFNELQRKLNEGYFAGPYLQNILRNYPDLVPSIPALSRHLSAYPEKARLELTRA